MSGSRLRLSVDQMMATAREVAGIDLPDEEALEPLRILHHALCEEASLDEEGARAYERKFVRLLANRLRMKRDFLRHPEIVEQEIKGPVVIMGVARSGTTKLQKVLAASGQFNFLTFWQNFNWASDSGVPGEALDRRIAEADEFCRWYDLRSPETKLGHHFEAMEPEEEGPLSEGCLVAPSFIGYAEMPSYARWLGGQPRSILFTFLRDVLKYQQWQGLADPGKPWLLKSPNYNGFEPLIRSIFPDARFVVAHRSPLETLASMCKLVRCFRQAFGSPEVDDGLIVEGNYRGVEAHLANRAQHPDIPFLDLRFQDVVGALPQTIERIYAFAGMPLDEYSRQRMLDWNAANAMHKLGAFQYSLSDAGLDEAIVKQRMAGYIDFIGRLEPVR